MSIKPFAERQFALRLPFVRHILFLMVLLTVSTVVFAAEPIKIEAEASQGVTLNGVQIAQTPAGFSGSGFAWGFDAASDNISFTFSAPAGEYNLSMGYYSPYGSKTAKLTINGVDSDQVLAGTGTNFSTAAIGKFQLPEGQNSITITNNWGYYGIDYILLTPVSVVPPDIIPLVNGRIEAEDGSLSGVDVATANAGFSGTGYVTGFDNGTDQVSITFNATAGLYELSIRYASPYGDKGVDYQVNDEVGSNTFKQTTNGYGTLVAGKFLLTDGLNTVVIRNGWGYFNIDYIQITPTTDTIATAAESIKIEAEAAEGVALNGVQIAQTPAGYSDSGFAWGFDAATDNISFTFSAPAGEYNLSIGYYSPYGSKTAKLTVNGVDSDQVLAGTGTNFGTAAIGKFQLPEGQSTITIINNWGYYGIDYILLTLVNVAPPDTIPLVSGRIEAEDGNLSGVDVATANAGFSGTGYVTGFDNGSDQVSITFNATAGLYELSIGYASPYGDKSVSYEVNDESGTNTFVQTPSGYGTLAAGKFLLKEGSNTVVIRNGWGYFDIDYIQITPTTVPLPIKPPKTLVDAQATPSTLGLFSYMVDQYGSKLISAQQDDVEYVLEKTGKEPAIGAFDLMDYSPSRIENQANLTPVRTSEAMIAWAKKDEGRGIISLSWHWNAPTDLINQAPDKLWWSGFYAGATTFDLAAVLADKNGSRYQLLLRDIDAIAFQLKKFQAADVPVLWRPLHEASGQWFWWGAKGSGPFKELWQLLHNRLTTHHQLHNLIWVYAGTDTIDPDWYPGDAYVDIVGEDIYADATSNMSGNWENALSQFDGRKMVALTESGHLPNLAKVQTFATWWSWFSLWSGDNYIKSQPIDVLQSTFNSELVITRDELPNWRPSSARFAAEEKSLSSLRVTLLGNPVVGEQAGITIQGAGESAVWLTLTDLKGTTLFQGKIEQTTETERHTILLGRKSGLFLLRVNTMNESTVVKFIKP